MHLSIIIVTRNRSNDLRKTLDSMKGVQVPADFEVELLVIDNGSSDNTIDVVRSCDIHGVHVRYLFEKRLGLSNGRNRGLAEAKGEILLFTDDDVRLPAGWIKGMCEPILAGKGDAVAGGVKIAPNLLCSWMSPMHRGWLASTEWLECGKPQALVGANMAFSKHVLEKVPRFDDELGAGALGSCEEILFSDQLIAAGYEIADRTDLFVEHHFLASRLKRSSWLDAAEKRGISDAYLGHHWEHWGCRIGKIKTFIAYAKIIAWRVTHSSEIREEGCSEQELSLVYHHALIRAHSKFSRQPRNYAKHGLSKIWHEME
jgi:glycosyltransferase involved in cell wall biosynthesis